jgi:hypothetical protein
MSKKSTVTIRIGANIDSVFVDGREFDRSKMSMQESRKVRQIIVNFFATGKIGK